MFLKTSLRAQLLALIGASLLLMLAIALASFSSLSDKISAYQRLLEGPIEASRLIDQSNLEFKVQVQEWKNVLLRGKSPENLTKYWQSFEEQEHKVQALLGTLVQASQDAPALAGQLQSLRDEHLKLGAAYRTGLDAFIKANGDPVAGDAAVKGIDRATSEQMAQLVDQLRDSALLSSASISRDANRSIITGTMIMLAAGVLIGLASLWILNRNLIAPIRHLIDHVAKLSEGKIGQRTDVSRADELGRLAAAADVLRDFLADTFARLQRSTSDLDSASGELHTIAAHMGQGTREQFSRTDQVATAMHELSATAHEVARHAADAARAADAADQSAQQGETMMSSTIQTMTQMRGEISNTATVIRRLEADSGRIGKVLEVIRGIADQTNLLALNAAIEAARAGDAGRGFAVVADEVRTLAKRTAESTAEIHQIIDTVQTSAMDAVRAIENGQSHGDRGVEQVTEAGSMLHRITLEVEAIRDMNRQIATAAEEQTSVAEDISRNLIEITAVATTNQENVERTERSSRTLHELSTQLSEVTHRLVG